MASLDYGVLIKKNGVLLNNEENAEFSYEMEDTVGFEVKTIDSKKISGNYFNYIGDSEFLVCVYKGMVHIFSYEENKMLYANSHLGKSKFTEEEGWIENFELCYDFYKSVDCVRGVRLEFKRVDNGHRYSLRFRYKGDLYECLYGYGVAYVKENWYGKTQSLMNYLNNWY